LGDLHRLELGRGSLEARAVRPERSLARIGCWLRRIVHQGETYLVDQHAHNRSGMVMPMLTSGWDLQFPKPWP
jgi:hypothetical protein